MSLLLELAIPDLDWDLSERLVRDSQQPGLIPLYGRKRGRWFAGKPWLLISDVVADGTSVFDETEPGGDETAITPECREPLAQTLLFLGQRLSPGWRFHSGWGGDAEREHPISIEELAELARRSELDANVWYRVVI